MSRTNEGKGNHVDAHLDKRIEKAKVLRGWCRDAKSVGWNVNSGSTGQMSAVIYSDPKMVSLSSEGLNLHSAVTEHQLIAFVNIG
jgi:hypothetical protein